ncbi:hypothetical protein K9N68_18050 [Kovacikia minuta CCNUW1]|uniref:DUF6999 family protein n=1 Tax=Kovacikia minuta TaxID=2931930 RepID=UPI001CC9A057|nr:hypothetical protein [Kovacikia minuta]UBF23675.1 hypothetical protein K9N68_18050 [Kovacikia minuta CCNUW1]
MQSINQEPKIALSQTSHAEDGYYIPQPHDRNNPSVWDALYLDQAIPVDPVAKSYMIKDLQNWTRNYLLLPIKLIANISLALIMTMKRLLPFQFSNYKLMHRSAAWFLKTFVSPEACYLIVRHICLGSNIVNFLIDNGPDATIAKSTLYPLTVDDLAKNAFLEHDLILYNFVLDYSKAQQENPHWLQQVKDRGLTYGSIQPVPVEVDFSRRRWLQLDLESAIELFKVFYSLCLTSEEFERAVLSLEFDENFGCYFSTVTGDHNWNHVITNRHPLAPESPFGAARRLLLHGIITEYLHRYLELAKVASDSVASKKTLTN